MKSIEIIEISICSNAWCWELSWCLSERLSWDSWGMKAQIDVIKVSPEPLVRHALVKTLTVGSPIPHRIAAALVLDQFGKAGISWFIMILMKDPVKPLLFFGVHRIFVPKSRLFQNWTGSYLSRCHQTHMCNMLPAHDAGHCDVVQCGRSHARGGVHGRLGCVLCSPRSLDDVICGICLQVISSCLNKVGGVNMASAQFRSLQFAGSDENQRLRQETGWHVLLCHGAFGPLLWHCAIQGLDQGGMSRCDLWSNSVRRNGEPQGKSWTHLTHLGHLGTWDTVHCLRSFGPKLLTCQLLQLFIGRNDARVYEVLFWFDLFSHGKHNQLFNWQSWQHCQCPSHARQSLSPGGHLLRCRAGTRTPAPGGLLGGSLPSLTQGSGDCCAWSHWSHQDRCGAKRCENVVHGGHVEYEGWQSGVERNNFVERYGSLLLATFATEYRRAGSYQKNEEKWYREVSVQPALRRP